MTGVEIFENDLTYFDGSPEEVRALAASLELEIIALQPFRDFEGLPEPLRTRAFDRAQAQVRADEPAGHHACSWSAAASRPTPSTTWRGSPPTCTSWASSRRPTVSPSASRPCAGAGTSTTTARPGRRCSGGPPEVGVILDTFHALARKCPVEPIAEIPAERIVLVQTADAPAIDMDLLFLSRHYRSFPGQGELPVVEMMRKLARSATGAGSATRSSATISAPARRARPRSTACVRSAGSTSSWATAGPHPSPRWRHRVPGVRDDPGSAAPFRAMLQALGFRRTHRHRSKDVELHSQGEIRIVLNLEDEGFAHSFQLLHGLSVAASPCASTTRTAAVRRATELLGNHFRGPIGQGELALPAMRGSAAACSTSSTEPEPRRLPGGRLPPRRGARRHPTGPAPSTIWPRSCRRPSSWAGSSSIAPFSG